MDEFRRLLRDGVREFGGTKQELARAIGIAPSAISRLLRRGVPSTDVCLRLARVTGVSASQLLRAAGKTYTADLLEELYGPAAARRQAFLGVRRITPHEQRHLTLVRALPAKEQRAFFVLIEYAVAQRSPGATLRFDAGRKDAQTRDD